ncbi:Electron transport complex subunit RsxB [Candidatus Brocadiaceae bacterium B188]|nr:4Fe-4S binding protein [Candidatus Brocadia sapporoensis]QQR66607.1 MAG: 4Fe-4S binding protein [Candidatus Brocadia sp.]TWU53570.1 Electron transport complex subunit RsxB [Candidatus Brocadiaceae bacterium B188]
MQYHSPARDMQIIIVVDKVVCVGCEECLRTCPVDLIVI